MTPEQATLLRGLLWEENEARFLADWCSVTDIESVDGSSHQLLPLLFRKLSQRELMPGSIERIRGVYRKSWYRNQQHLAALSKAIEALDAAGIDHTVVSGLPIALAAYGDLGTRALYVVRLVVPPTDVARSVDLLARRGFYIQRRALSHGWGIPTLLGTPTGGVLDLRGSVYGPGWAHAPDEELKARRVPLDCNGVRTLTLDAIDTIVEAAVSAGSGRQVWLQGLADVALLSRATEPELDWSKVSVRYGGTALSVPLHDALTDLINELDVPLGDGAAIWHAANRARLVDRASFWGHRNGRRLVRLPPWFWRGRRANGQRATPAGFVSFAAAVYGVESPADAVRRLRRRLTFRRIK